MNRIGRIFVWSLLVGGSAFGQQQQATTGNGQEGPYSLQVNARMVVLDVVVTNKQGQTVDNLTKDDFTVFEDKVPQTVVSLERSATVLPPANVAINSTRELDKLEPNIPVNIIVLDEVNTRFEDEAFARYSVTKYLKAQGDLLTLPTMLVAVDLQHFMVLRDYTRSEKEILSALDHHFTQYPWHLSGGSWKAEQFVAGFSSLMQVAQATAGHAGHKNLIWIGRGFPSVDPLQLTPDAEAVLQNAIESCTNLLRDSRVTLYTVDPAGVSAAPQEVDEDGFVEDPFGGQVDFNAMAEATGGKAFYGRNDVDQLITTSAHDGASFYTLAYKPTGDSESAKPFRSIKVVLKDPTLHATTREGYYTNPPAVAAERDAKGKLTQGFAFDLSSAGQSMMVYDAVPLTLVRDPVAPDNFQINVPAADVDFQPNDAGKLRTEIAVLVESYDKKGKLLNHEVSVRHVAVVAGTPEAELKTRYVSVPVTIPTAAPAARLRFVVRIGGTGKLGADNYFLVDRKTLSDPTTGLTPSKH